MGSYLSIVNDTKDTWHCKIGPDEFAFKIFTLVVSLIGSMAALLVTAGAAAPAVAAMGGGVVGVFGVSSTALATAAAGVATAGSYATLAGGASAFSLGVAKAMANKLKDDGFSVIEPGQSKRFGKMTLSLWQQGTCTKQTIVSESIVRVDTLYMRPIFSGATANSNIDHKIQWWINKSGTESQQVVAQPPDAKPPSKLL
jgi:hypothetical protein